MPERAYVSRFDDGDMSIYQKGEQILVGEERFPQTREGIEAAVKAHMSAIDSDDHIRHNRANDLSFKDSLITWLEHKLLGKEIPTGTALYLDHSQISQET